MGLVTAIKDRALMRKNNGISYKNQYPTNRTNSNRYHLRLSLQLQEIKHCGL